MATYIYSKWHGSPQGSPVEFYSELDNERYEIRKVEVFRDGSYGYADKSNATKSTKLGVVPVPSIEEIAGDPEFDAKVITPKQFDEKWQEATSK